MGLPVALTVTLESEVCGNCGGTYALAAPFIRARRIDSKWWYCPYCQSSWHFGDGELDRVKRQLANAHELAARNLSRANIAEREKDKLEKTAKRLKRRISAGVCPCCNRTFTALARHIASKHPTYNPKGKS